MDRRSPFVEVVLGWAEAKAAKAPLDPAVAAKLKTLSIPGTKRVRDSANGVTFYDDSGRLYRPRPGEEDDDYPDFIGYEKVLAQAQAHFKGLDVDVDVMDQEKEYFSVSVTPK